MLGGCVLSSAAGRHQLSCQQADKDVGVKVNVAALCWDHGHGGKRRERSVVCNKARLFGFVEGATADPDDVIVLPHRRHTPVLPRQL